MDAHSLTITPAEFDHNIQIALDDLDSALNIAQKTRSPSPDETPQTPDASKESPKMLFSPTRPYPGTPQDTSSPLLEADPASASMLLAQNEHDRELLQDFDLQMAMALSLSESEAKSVQREEDNWGFKQEESS